MAERICSLPDCEESTGVPGTARGLCSKHYQRLRKRGTTDDPQRPPRPACSIESCPNSVHGRQPWCKDHYERNRRHGDPTAGRLPHTASLEERFWSKVNKDGPAPEYRPELGPCWVWKGGPRDGDGYGQLNPPGERPILAHRFAYKLLVGPIPEGLEPDHLCRVRACVKAIADEHGPAHLEMVTHQVNCQRGNNRFNGADQRAKAHCPQGHPYDQANTYIGFSGERQCRICRREAKRRYNERQKELRRLGSRL